MRRMTKRLLIAFGVVWIGATPTLSFANQPLAEKPRSIYSKGLLEPPFEPHQFIARIPTSFSFPTRFDWRELGKVTSVKNQSTCGACYAFAYLAEIESKLLIADQGEFDFSENNVKECEWFNRTGRQPSGCAGGTAWRVVNLLSEKGTVLEQCDRYEPYESVCKDTCPYIKTVLNWRVFSLTNVPSTETIKHYVYNYGPVFVAMYAGKGDSWEDEFENYDGSYTLYYSGPGGVNHAVLIVGWDDTLSHRGGQGAWIVKNSWGTNWGGTCGYGNERGYFTIGYGSAGIGSYGCFTTEWRDFDIRDIVLLHDEAGYGNHYGFGNTTAWGMNIFTPPVDAIIDRVELWTSSAVDTLEIFIYDSFAGGKPINLLTHEKRSGLSELGYVSVALSESLKAIANDPIYVIARIKNAFFEYPLVYDRKGVGPTSGLSYVSADGRLWQQFIDGDLGIRVRLKDIFPPDTLSWFRATPVEDKVKLMWMNPRTSDFSFTKIRYSMDHFPENPQDGLPVDGAEGLFHGSPASADSFVHPVDSPSENYFYSAFAFDRRGNYSKRVVALATLLDTIPPEMKISVFQNPYLTSHLDIYLKASEPIIDTSLVVRANDNLLEPTLVDWQESLYRCDYDVYQSGILHLEAYARDLSLNRGHTERHFGVTKINSLGGCVSSPGGGMLLEIPPNAIGREIFVLSEKEYDETISSMVYCFYPDWLVFSKRATLMISSDGLISEDLTIVRLDQSQPETLETYMDLEKQALVAYIMGFGKYTVARRNPNPPTSQHSQVALAVSPNPSVSSPSILLSVSNEDKIDLSIYSIQGQLVKNLYSGTIKPGQYRFEWDGRNQEGRSVGAGIYVCSLKSKSGQINRKIVLVR